VSLPVPEPTASTIPAELLDACAREPIHIPGGIQPHGMLWVLAPSDLRVLQASANAAERLPPAEGDPRLPAPERAEGGPALLDELRRWLDEGSDAAFLGRATLDGVACQVGAHRGPQGVLVELEPGPEPDEPARPPLYPQLQAFLGRIEVESELAVLGRLAADEVRRLTGFHRVMLYRFDEDWNGTVLAESGDGTLPSYLDLRFPASDIPAQARELYRRNRIRLICRSEYEPVPIMPALSPVDGQPLDLGLAALRSVSPVHLAYMRNMGTAASMSISLLVDGALWGLLSCHHAVPRHVGPQVRAACDFLGQVLALQLAARERHARASRRLAAKSLETELLARASREESFESGLVRNPSALLQLVDAHGAAVLKDNAVMVVGRTPDIEQIRGLAAWLKRRGDDPVFATDALPRVYGPAEDFADRGSGLLAVSISALHPDYILWFRPEVIHTVNWGGRPDKLGSSPAGPLHPRSSFERWAETVVHHARRWDGIEVDAAREFRHAIVEYVLRRAEERAALTQKLESSNKELETFSYSVSHDLRAPFRHIVGFAQLLASREKNLDEKSRHYLDAVVQAALSAGRLVDDLLNFSQLGRSSLDMGPVDMDKTVAEVLRGREFDLKDRSVVWQIDPLPPAWGDAALLRQVIGNLVDNALKYTRTRETARIAITAQVDERETAYAVADNGIGFDMAYADKLFGVFQRLHRMEDYEGSGIGLALTRRIVDRHGGRIDAQGAVDKGATFRFWLPNRPASGRTA
jgi:light-regulated signal transduction histidine kinase (bacteriophytochrome)